MDHGGRSGHAGHGTGGGGGMNHGGSGVDMPMMCSMDMLWNSRVQGVCVVFERWHIATWWGMIFSCLVVIAISLFYAQLLHSARRLDRRIAVSLYLSQSSTPNGSSTSTGAGMDHSNLNLESGGGGRASPGPGSLLRPGATGSSSSGASGITKLPKHVRIHRAGMYAVSVAVSFFLMLVAMTYNTYLFASIVLGAGLGHFLYEDEMDVGAVLSGSQSKGLACH